MKTKLKMKSNKSPIEFRYTIMQWTERMLADRGLEFHGLPYITHNQPATYEEFTRYLQSYQQMTGK